MTTILEPQTSAPAAAATPASVPVVAVRSESAPPPPALPAPAETAATETAPTARRPSRLRRILSERPELTPAGVRGIGIAMVALFWAAVTLDPPAAGPDPTVTGWVAVLVNVQTFALLAGAAGFAMGRRWALWAALLFGGIGAVNVALCPASGHHVIGGWWFGQVALGAAMLLLPALALRRTRPGRP